LRGATVEAQKKGQADQPLFSHEKPSSRINQTEHSKQSIATMIAKFPLPCGYFLIFSWSLWAGKYQ
jgi:hypothetical protein